MSPTPPPVARGGSDNPLAKFKRGGLKKAAGSGVVAEMISSPGPEQPAAEPAPQPPVPDRAPETAATPAADPARRPLEAAQAPGEPAPLQSSPQDAPAPAYFQAVRVPAEPDHMAHAAQHDPAPAVTVQLPPAQTVLQAAPQYPQPVQAPVPQYGQPMPAKAPAVDPQQPAPPKSKKTSFHQPLDSGDRMRSTYNATRHLTKYMTMSEFICAAVDKMCAELEEKYNDGERFDADPGAVPKGRPVGS